MYPQTKKMIRMALDADNTVASQSREQIEAALGDNPAPEAPQLLKQKEVAQLLSLSRQSIRNLVRVGKLHPVEISNGLVRYRREEALGLGKEVGHVE